MCPQKRCELHYHPLFYGEETHRSRSEKILSTAFGLLDKGKGADIIALTEHGCSVALDILHRYVEDKEKYDVYKVDDVFSVKYRGKEIEFLRGNEFFVTEDLLHVIGIGNVSYIPNKLEIMELMDKLKDHNTIIDIPHPFNTDVSGIGEGNLYRILKDSAVKERLMIEVFNSFAHALPSYRKCDDAAEKFAEENNIPQVVGSDAHSPKFIGTSLTLVPNLLEIENTNSDDFIKSLRKNIESAERVKRPIGFMPAVINYLPLFAMEKLDNISNGKICRDPELYYLDNPLY